jgi:hypothetical protein
MAKTLPKSALRSSASLKSSPNITIHQTYDGATYARVVKYRKARGLLTDQEIGRLAMSYFLEHQGY